MIDLSLKMGLEGAVCVLSDYVCVGVCVLRLGIFERGRVPACVCVRVCVFCVLV